MIDEFKKLNQAIYKGKRAPHKPLLILLALAKIQQGQSQFIPYEAIDKELRELLIDFGPLRKRYQPELPFFHLQNDGIWQIKGNSPDEVEALEPMRSPSRRYFLDNNICGGFPDHIFNEITNDRQQLNEIVSISVQN